MKATGVKIALTGGIACGKSLVATMLRDEGVETLDADDIVHELIPAEERKRLAGTVFTDESARRALESRIHPIVKRRILDWFSSPDRPSCAAEQLRIAIIPLLFEVKWDAEYDIILCVTSEKANQIARMTSMRGYTREEAESRLAAQLPVEEKAAKSHIVIANDGTVRELRNAVREAVGQLKLEIEKKRVEKKEVENGRRV